MSRLVRLTSRWWRNWRRHRDKKAGAHALASRRKSDLELVSQANGIDVGLLDVSAHPEVIGIDQRDDRLAEIYHLSAKCGAL
jgi:hypothetical protein